MANIKSQIKRNRQNEAAFERNRRVRSRLKTLTRNFRRSAESGERDVAEAAYQQAAKAYDKAASKGVVHRNTAANKKSGMAKRLAKL